MLQAILGRLKTRVMAVGVTSATSWGLTALIVVALAGAWLDLILELSSGLRLACVATAAGAGLVLLVVLAARAIRETSAAALAARLDAAAQASGQVVSGVHLQLGRQNRAGLEGGLAELAVERAAELAQRAMLPEAVPARPIVRAALGLGIACAVVLAIGLVAPSLARTQWLRFVDPFGDHPPYSPIRLTVEPGDARVVFGSGLDVRAVADGAPVDRMDLVIRMNERGPDDVLPMFPEPLGHWRATVASVTAAGRYFVRAHGARSRQYRLDVVTVPRIESVRLRITPPAYTHLPPYEGPLPQSGLAGLPGTQVEMWAKSNRPLSGGTLEISSGTGKRQIAMQRGKSDEEVRGAFEIREPGKLEMHVIDVAQQASTDAFAASFSVLPDEHPFVRLLEPHDVSFATPDVMLPAVIAAEDDYGVARVQLFRSLNDSRALPMELPVPAAQPTHWSGTVELPLSAYRLEPGDVIKLFARVEDNDPAGAKGAESTVAIVQIISREEFEQLVRTQQGLEVLQSKYHQAQRRLEETLEEMEKLQKELEKLPPESELAREHRRRLEELTKKMQEDAEAIAKAADNKLPYEVDKTLSKELEKLAQSAREAANEARAMASQTRLKAGLTARQLAELRKKLEQRKGEFKQQAGEPLEQFASVYRLMEDQARFVALYQRQRDLAERMASLKGHDSQDDPKLKARMRDLETEQKGLREGLAQLLDDIEAHAAQLPEKPELDKLRDTAREFAQAVRESDGAEQMSNCEQALGQFAGSTAAIESKAAADTLEQFLSKCKGMGSKSKQCLAFKPSLSACMNASAAQLLADAGLNSGDNMGAGSGYSAARSSLQNVGLYGAMTAMTQQARSGSGKRSATSAGSAAWGGRGGDSIGLAAPVHTGVRAGGAGEAAVPLPYRRRVGEYFQRIADELGQAPEARP